MKVRIDEIVNSMTSCNKTLYSKKEMLSELFALQGEMVNLTFNDTHAENGNLRIWDVESHLKSLNEDCGHVADDLLEKFMNQCKDVCNTIKAEKSGQDGEYKAFKSLDTLRCKNTVLRNVELTTEDHRAELDAVVITEKAVFIVEVKNTGKDIRIDERGNYCRFSHDWIFDKNIGEKMNEKDYLLRQALKDCGIENINIQNIVVFTNSAVHVENCFPYINICYLSDMPHIIGGYRGERIYTDEDMKTFAQAVEASRRHEGYPMPIDMQAFKNDFATLMATLEKATEAREKTTEAATTEKQVTEEVTLCATEAVEDEKRAKEYPPVAAWLNKHKFLSSLVASIAVVALSSVVAVAAATKR